MALNLFRQKAERSRRVLSSSNSLHEINERLEFQTREHGQPKKLGGHCVGQNRGDLRQRLLVEELRCLSNKLSADFMQRL